MNDRETKVHAHHCCKKHGCKYGDENCPVAYGDIEQVHPCIDCDDGYDDDELGIEWIIKERRKDYENEQKAFLKGFIMAMLIVILLHIGLAYVLL